MSRARWRMIKGEALWELRTLEASSVDAIVTDPPYSSGGFTRGDRMQKPSRKYEDTSIRGVLTGGEARSARVRRPNEGKAVMKVVFLDFDGVLNSHEYMQHRAPASERGSVAGIDSVAVTRLNCLLKETGAKVVVSSSWRHGRTLAELRRILDEAGFVGDVFGKTPDCAHKPEGGLWHGAMRGNEIQTWIDLAPLYGVEVESFVILDDDSDMAHLADRHIKTAIETGLTSKDVERAFRLLAVPMPAIVVPSAEMSLRFT